MGDRTRDRKLLRLIRVRPELYDTAHCDYHNRTRRDEAWHQICEQMKAPRDECRRRWADMRDYYRKTLTKRRRTSLNGGVDFRPLKLENELKFLLPHISLAGKRKRGPDEETLGSFATESFISEDVDEERELYPADEEEQEITYADSDLAEQEIQETGNEMRDMLQELTEMRRQDRGTRNDHIATFFKSMEQTVRTLPLAAQTEAKKIISAVVFDLEGGARRAESSAPRAKNRIEPY